MTVLLKKSIHANYVWANQDKAKLFASLEGQIKMGDMTLNTVFIRSKFIINLKLDKDLYKIIRNFARNPTKLP